MQRTSLPSRGGTPDWLSIARGDLFPGDACTVKPVAPAHASRYRRGPLVPPIAAQPHLQQRLQERRRTDAALRQWAPTMPMPTQPLQDVPEPPVKRPWLSLLIGAAVLAAAFAGAALLARATPPIW